MKDLIVCTRHLIRVGMKVEMSVVGTAWQFVKEKLS